MGKSTIKYFLGNPPKNPKYSLKHLVFCVLIGDKKGISRKNPILLNVNLFYGVKVFIKFLEFIPPPIFSIDFDPLIQFQFIFGYPQPHPHPNPDPFPTVSIQ